jgi:branched-subunit amino acid aminotransferase/4-amino-4-deoxychorismate lyase
MHVYSNYNGFLVEDGEKLFSSNNRAFKFGDALFESLKVSNSKVLHWDKHYQRLQYTLDFLGFDSTGVDQAFWENQLQKVFVRNNFPDARLRLTIYRDSPGLYVPQRHKCAFLIEGAQLDKSNYELNVKGLNIGLYSDVLRSRQKFSNLKTTNSLPYILAGLFAEKHSFDDVVILNDAGRVSEAVSSNVFVVLGDQIITPSLDEGCINGVMRKVLLEMHPGKIKEALVDVDMLKKADEIFFTNAIRGIQWVGSFDGKSYACNRSSQLMNVLNMSL